MANEIASFYAKVGADTGEFQKGLLGVKSDMGGLEKGSAALGNALKAAFAIGVTAIAGFGAVIGKSIGAAADMEQGIADIGAVMGLTGQETAQLQDHIMDLGLDPKLKVSATEASEAIMALGTAGLTTTEIMGGASKATVLLANATGAQFGDAATIATDVMAQFNIQASDMSEAVNQITGVTVASKFTIQDYQLAIAQAGGVAGSVGVDFEDFNATIAATAPSFASGSDAGTSFKTFLQRLVPTTNDAKEALIQLGLSTGDDYVTAFFTAEGAMRPMEEIAQNLKTAFSGLSESQRIEAASTIFGTDAMRTALALAEGGEAIITEMKAAIGNTDAEESAATRMNTFAGAIEIARGVMETLSIGIGQKFLPVLRPMVEKFTELAQRIGPQVVDFFGALAESMAGTIQKMMDWAQNVLPPLWTNLQHIGNALKIVTFHVMQALVPITQTIGKWIGWQDVLMAVGAILMGTVVIAIAGFVAALAPVILLVAKVAAVIALLKAAWENNFLGIRDITKNVIDNITIWFRSNFTVWQGSWSKTLEFFVNNANHAWGTLLTEITGYFGRMRDRIVAEVQHWISVVTRDIDYWVGRVDSLFTLWKNQTVATLKSWYTSSLHHFTEFRDDAIQRLMGLFAWFKPAEWYAKGRDIIQGVWNGAMDVWNRFKGWWDGLWRQLTGAVDVRLRIGSPSKEMEERGAWAVEGFAKGARSAMPLAMDAMGGLSMGTLAAGESGTATGVSTTRIEELLMILIQELRAKSLTANVSVARGGADYAGLVSYKAGGI